MKVSLSSESDIILCGWLGLKHQLTNHRYVGTSTFLFGLYVSGWNIVSRQHFISYQCLCCFYAVSVCVRVTDSIGPFLVSLQWGTADAEINVPSGENTELKRCPFKAWSRSVYNHTCYAYCHGFLPCLLLPFRSIHLCFSKNSPVFFMCWLWLTPVPV